MNERMVRRSSNTDSSSSSSSSSIDSSRVPYNHHHQQQQQQQHGRNNINNRSDLSTELRLGLSQLLTSSTSQSHPPSYSYDEPAANSEYWTPNKSLLFPTSRLPENNNTNNGNNINCNNINCAPPQEIRINRQAAESSSSSSAAAAAADGTHFFVKVYMEGIPIGRKLDLFAHHGYHELVTTLTRMFRTNILYPGIDRVHYDQDHVLTYEDKEGDLMMVGDVPWDLFLSTVKKLKITRSDNC